VLARANQIISGPVGSSIYDAWSAISNDNDGRDSAKDAVGVLRKIVAVQQVVQGDRVVELLTLYAEGQAKDSKGVVVADAITTLLDDSSASGLSQLADKAIVGPIVPSRFTVAYAPPAAELNQVSGGVPFTYEGSADGGDRLLKFVINRSGGLDGTVVLRYEIQGSAALTADRFEGGIPKGELTFDADETQKVLTIRVLNDQARDPNELLSLVLTDAYGNSQFADAAGKLTVSGVAKVRLLDDDPNTPVISGPSSLDVVADQATAMPGLSVDYYSASGPLKLVLSAVHGDLSGASLEKQADGSYWAFKTVTATGGASTRSYELTLAEVNDQLAQLRFDGDAGSVKGQVHGEVLAVGRTVSGVFDVAVGIHNPATIVQAPVQQSVTAATLSRIGPIVVADADATSLKVTLTSSGGEVLAGTSTNVFVNKPTAGVLILEGAPVAVNAALANLSFNATAGRTSASIQISVNDGDSLTVDPGQTVSLTVQKAAPTASLPSQLSATVGIDTLLSGIQVADVDSASITARLSVSAGATVMLSPV